MHDCCVGVLLCLLQRVWLTDSAWLKCCAVKWETLTTCNHNKTRLSTWYFCLTLLPPRVHLSVCILGSSKSGHPGSMCILRVCVSWEHVYPHSILWVCILKVCVSWDYFFPSTDGRDSPPQARVNRTGAEVGGSDMEGLPMPPAGMGTSSGGGGLEYPVGLMSLRSISRQQQKIKCKLWFHLLT